MRTLKCYEGCEACETPISVRRIALTVIAILLLLCVFSPWLFGQTAPFFNTPDFRSVANTTTHATSTQICGEGYTGMFFNISDYGGGSCVSNLGVWCNGASQQTAAGIQCSAPLVWVQMNDAGSLRVRPCHDEWVACKLPPNTETCDMALPWQAFRTSDLSYAGESLSLGGSLVQPVVKGYVCPAATPVVANTTTPNTTSTPRPAPSVSPSQSPRPNSTPSYTAIPAPCLRLPCQPKPSPTTNTPVPSSTPVPRSPTPTVTGSSAPAPSATAPKPITRTAVPTSTASRTTATYTPTSASTSTVPSGGSGSSNPIPSSGSTFLKAVAGLVIALGIFGKRIVAKVKSWF